MKNYPLLHTLGGTTFLLILLVIFGNLYAEISIDKEFLTGSGFNNTVSYIKKQINGQYIIGGNFSTYNNSSGSNLIRLQSNGIKDSVFIGGNIGFSGSNIQIKSIFQKTNGQYIIGGWGWSHYNGSMISSGILQLNNDGSIDNTFLSQLGVGCDNMVQSIITQPLDGKILIGGDFINCKGTNVGRITRLTASGTIDGTFNAQATLGKGANATVRQVTLQNDTSILIGGDFSLYNNISVQSLIRLTHTGGVDTTFNLGSISGNNASSIKKFLIYTGSNNTLTGKIYGLGIFGGNNYIFRANSSGSIDGTFTPVIVNSGTQSFVFQTDGRIIVGDNNQLIRFNTNGTSDATFNASGTLFSGSILALEIVSETIEGNTPIQLLVGGNLAAFGTGIIGNIAQINVIPDKPTTPTVAPKILGSSDTGYDPKDGITNRMYPIFTGTGCMNGNIVTLQVDGGNIGSGSCINNEYVIQSNIPLSHGIHGANILYTNLGGTSSISPTLSFEIDVINPTINPTIILPLSGSTFTGGIITLNGTGGANGIIFLQKNGVNYLTGSTDIGGNWSITTGNLGEGTHNFIAHFEDYAGNSSPLNSSGVSIMIATITPNAPTITSPYNNAVLNTAQPTFFGTGTPGNNVSITVVGYGSYTGTIGIDGEWTIQPNLILSDATYTLQGTQTNNLGVTSPITTKTFSVRTNSTVIPFVPDMIDASDTGDSYTDNITNDQRPIFEGTNCTGPSDLITLKVDGELYGSGVCTNSGTYSMTVSKPISDGIHYVSVAYTLLGGYVTPDSDFLRITVDTVTPGAFALDNVEYIGLVVTPTLWSKVQKPVFSGLTESGITVSVTTLVGATLCSNISNNSGAYSCTSISPLLEGQNSLSIRICDKSGNCRTPMPTLNVNIDTIIPTKPTITYPPNNGITNNAKPTFQGTASSGNIVRLTINGNIYSSVVDANGNWVISVTNYLNDGTYSVDVYQMDKAQNTSEHITQNIIINSNASSGFSIIAPIPGTYLLTKNLSGTVFSGTCQTGSVIFMDTPIVATGTCINNTWAIPANLSALTDGNITVTIRQRDAGNNFSPSQPYFYIKDTVTPGLSFTSSVIPGGGTIEPIFVTLLGNEALSGFTVSNILISTGAQITDFAKISGTNNYSFVIRPYNEFVGRIGISLGTGSTTDLAGNTIIPVASNIYWNILPYSHANLYVNSRVQESYDDYLGKTIITVTTDYGNDGQSLAENGSISIKLDPRVTFIEAYINDGTYGRKLSFMENISSLLVPNAIAYYSSAVGSYQLNTKTYTVSLGKILAGEKGNIVVRTSVVKDGLTALNFQSTIYGQTKYQDAVRETNTNDNTSISHYITNEQDLLSSYLPDMNAATNQKVINNCSPLQEAVPLSDIHLLDSENHWANTYMKDIIRYGIEENSNYYLPNLAITRAEFIAMIVRALPCKYSIEELNNAESSFNDVTNDVWYSRYVGVAEENYWISNTTGFFRPYDAITRSEAVFIIMRTLGQMEIGDDIDFHDIEEGGYFQDAIRSARYFGIIDGSKIFGLSYFYPSNDLLRGEAAKIIENAFLQ